MLTPYELQKFADYVAHACEQTEAGTDLTRIMIARSLRQLELSRDILKTDVPNSGIRRRSKAAARPLAHLDLGSLMDRAVLLNHLALVERHVLEGERHLARQESMIAELDRDNHDTQGAYAVLETLRQTQANHIGERDRILRQLAQ